MSITPSSTTIDTDLAQRLREIAKEQDDLMARVPVSLGDQSMPLSPRERQVAALVAEELSNKQIAYELMISEETVHTHLKNIREKTGLRKRVSLALAVERSNPKHDDVLETLREASTVLIGLAAALGPLEGLLASATDVPYGQPVAATAAATTKIAA